MNSSAAINTNEPATRPITCATNERTPIVSTTMTPENHCDFDYDSIPKRIPQEGERIHSKYDVRLIVSVIVAALFGIVNVMALSRVLSISNKMLTHVQQWPDVSPLGTWHLVTKPGSRDGSTTLADSMSDTMSGRMSDDKPRILIVYSSGTHLSKLAKSVEQGVQTVLTPSYTETHLRIRTTDNAVFDDVTWADGVILGSQVINANVNPKMATFLSSWDIDTDMSRKVGAAFVTGGGISAGLELTILNLLHSMMIFRMVIVGGERWTSAFGASAVVAEGPFQPRPFDESGRQFPAVCYPSDPDGLHWIFKEKAVGLGRRVASMAAIIKEHSLVEL